MNKADLQLLLIVTSDPRTSARPAEAIRMAAGVAAWKKAAVNVCLQGAAVLALGEFPDELVDEDSFVRYLPILGEMSQRIYTRNAAPFLAQIGRTTLAYQEINETELAALAARSTYVARF